MNEQIVLYSSSECTRCKIVKNMLDINHIPYDDVTDKELMVDMGFEEVPILEVDGKIIEGFARIITWLEEKGYYSENGII